MGNHSVADAYSFPTISLPRPSSIILSKNYHTSKTQFPNICRCSLPQNPTNLPKQANTETYTRKQTSSSHQSLPMTTNKQNPRNQSSDTRTEQQQKQTKGSTEKQLYFNFQGIQKTPMVIYIIIPCDNNLFPPP